MHITTIVMRFNVLDGQIHDIHDLLTSFQTRNDPQDDLVCWTLGSYIASMCLCYFNLSSVSFSRLFLNFNRLIVSVSIFYSLL